MSKPCFAPDPLLSAPTSGRGSSPRLRIAPDIAHSGPLGGARWPRSHDAAAELPGLIGGIGMVAVGSNRLTAPYTR